MVIPGMGHSGSGTVGGIIGLQHIYSKPALKLDNFLLDQYAGHYVSDKDSLSITRSGNNLYSQSASDKVKLFAETPESFYVKGFSGSLQFKKDNKDKVTGFNLIKSDTTVFFKRIN